jgi:hypothetical protein
MQKSENKFGLIEQTMKNMKEAVNRDLDLDLLQSKGRSGVKEWFTSAE